jgi:hypothetical protein
MKTCISLIIYTSFIQVSLQKDGMPYSLISRIQTECETEALNIGTILADTYNSYDEDTEWDIRLHHDFLTEHLGFAGWIQMGTWGSSGKTSHGNHAPTLHKAF